MIWNLCIGALGAGIVGAFVFDLWNWLVENYLGIRAPRWAILGRWLLHPCSTAPPAMGPAAVPFTTNETVVGTLAHYATGVAFAFIFLGLMGEGWVTAPTVAPAVIAGLVTTLFAWLVIMPALGLGITGSRIPHANRHRVATLVSHGVMGLGFYIGAAATEACQLYGAFR